MTDYNKAEVNGALSFLASLWSGPPYTSVSADDLGDYAFTKEDAVRLLEYLEERAADTALLCAGALCGGCRGDWVQDGHDKVPKQFGVYLLKHAFSDAPESVELAVSCKAWKMYQAVEDG